MEKIPNYILRNSILITPTSDFQKLVNGERRKVASLLNLCLWNIIRGSEVIEKMDQTVDNFDTYESGNFNIFMDATFMQNAIMDRMKKMKYTRLFDSREDFVEYEKEENDGNFDIICHGKKVFTSTEASLTMPLYCGWKYDPPTIIRVRPLSTWYKSSDATLGHHLMKIYQWRGSHVTPSILSEDIDRQINDHKFLKRKRELNAEEQYKVHVILNGECVDTYLLTTNRVCRQKK